MRLILTIAAALGFAWSAYALTPAELYQQHQTLQQQLDAVAKQLRDLVPVKPPPVEPPPVEPPPPPVSGGPLEMFATTAALIPYDYTARFVTPIVIKDGRAADHASGAVRLGFTVTDRYGNKQPHAITRVRYGVDGAFGAAVPVGASTTLPDQSAVFALQDFDAAALATGPHVLTVRLVDGGGLQSTRTRASLLLTGTVGASGPPAHLVPAFGGTAGSVHRNNGIADFAPWPGGTARPRSAVVVPFKPGFSPPVHSLGVDPLTKVAVGNWWLEPVWQSTQTLYQGEPEWRVNAGWPVVRNFTWQSGNSATAALDHVRRFARYDGPREQNQVNPYSTFNFLPDGKSLVSIDLAGDLSILGLDGSKRNVAGFRYRDATVLRDRGTTAEIANDNHEQVGDWEAHRRPGWSAPHDAIPLARDPEKQFLVANSFDHTIEHVDLNFSPPKIRIIAGVFGKNGLTAGNDNDPLASRIDRPYSVDELPDGRIVITCTPAAENAANSAVYVLSADWKRLTLLAQKPQVSRPFVGKSDSAGKVILYEHGSAWIKELDPNTGVVTPLWNTGSPAEWVWIAIDKFGTVGPKDDVFTLSSTNGPGNTTLKRFSRTGTYRGEYLKQSIGVAAQGPADRTAEPHAHYQWTMAISPVESRTVLYGFGDMGPKSVRLIAANENRPVYDHVAFRTGQAIFESGTLPGFPTTIRPSGTALRSHYGHSWLGTVPSFDQMAATMTDAQRRDYMRAGWGGAVPRPELDGYALDLLMYFVDYSTYPLKPGLKPPVPPSDKTGPSVTAYTADRLSDGRLRVRWSTDEEATCVVAHGVSSGAWHAATTPSPWGTAGELTVEDAGPFHVLRCADKAGNHRQSKALAA